MSVYSLSIDNFNLSNGNKRTLDIDLQDPITLVYFKQAACGQCKGFDPIFSQLVHRESSISYAVCDLTDKNRDVFVMAKASSMPITGVPTIVVYIRGKPFAKFKGKRNVPSLSSFISKIKVLISLHQANVSQPQRQQAKHRPQLKGPAAGVPDDEEDNELMMPESVTPHNRPWNTDRKGKYATLD